MFKLALFFLTILFIPTLAIAQPEQWDDISVYPIPELTSEVVTPLLKPEMPRSVLYNCWEYVRQVYPQTPPTRQILANLGTEGEIGVLTYYGWLKHYVVVEKIEGDLVYFNETNYKKGTYSERVLSVSEFDGFFKL